MTNKIVAKLDIQGTSMSQRFHYTFGKRGDDVSGGVYIKKGMENPPDFIEIEIPMRKGE